MSFKPSPFTSFILLNAAPVALVSITTFPVNSFVSHYVIENVANKKRLAKSVNKTFFIVISPIFYLFILANDIF